MRTFMRSVMAAAIVGGLTTACSNSDNAPTAPSALFAKGPGGGGTDTPPPPPTTTLPTVSIGSALIPGQSPLVGQAVNLFVVATSESGNRKAPTVNVIAAPAGLVLVSLTSVDSPHGGGPGYVEAGYAWTPTRDQIGLATTITITATTSAGTGGSTISYGAVQDAPSALTGLTATIAGDHIEARWDPSTGGVAPISYVVKACYRNANIRPVVSTCDLIATTTDAQLLDIPLSNPAPTVAPAGGVATYFALLVTPVDAAGNAGPTATANVQ